MHLQVQQHGLKNPRHEQAEPRSTEPARRATKHGTPCVAKSMFVLSAMGYVGRTNVGSGRDGTSSALSGVCHDGEGSERDEWERDNWKGASAVREV